MAKAKCKRDFLRFDIPTKIQFCRDREDDMNGNLLFPTPDVAYLLMTSKIDDLEDKYNLAQGGGEAQTAAQDAAELVLDDLMRKQCDYVDRIADGNTVTITSAGFTPTATSRTPVAPPLKPENFTLNHGKQPGTVLANCNAQKGVKSWLAIICYNINFPVVIDGSQITIQPGTTDVILHWSSDRKKTFASLNSGQRIYVKMYAVNAGGISPESDMIQIVVP